MAKKLAVRVDDRLIHGQVVTQWVNVFKAQHIVVIEKRIKVRSAAGYQSQYFLCGQSSGSMGEKSVRDEQCVRTFQGCKSDRRTPGKRGVL